MEFTEIVINYYKDAQTFNQIVFINNGFIEYVEPFALKYHSQYLNLDITIFKQIDK